MCGSTNYLGLARRATAARASASTRPGSSEDQDGTPTSNAWGAADGGPRVNP